MSYESAVDLKLSCCSYEKKLFMYLYKQLSIAKGILSVK